MNFKKMMKRGQEGFTLVELIVVIAILGILAGIGIPAYSGYVEKAQTAVEEQHIAMFHNAFVVACVGNGVDHTEFTAVGIDMTDGIFKGLTSLTRGGDPNQIVKDFNDFFGFPQATYEFKYLADKVADGILRGLETGSGSGETVKVTYNGKEITVSKELADKLKDNNLSELGAEVLLGKVDTVSTIVDGLLNLIDEETGLPKTDTTFYQMIWGEGSTYISDLEESLGMEPGELATSFETKEEYTNFIANSLVLSAAQKTENIDTSFLGTTGSAATLRAELDNPETATDAMAKLALTYGMYTSYVNSEQGKAQGLTDQSESIINNGTLTGMTSVLASIESKEFQDYLNSDEGKADLDAYLASMQIINDTTKDDPDAAKDILTNGFNSDELSGVLDGLMGNTTN